MRSTVNSILNSSLTLLGLSVLYPTAFLLSKNSYIYSNTQIAAAAIFMLSLALILILLSWSIRYAIHHITQRLFSTKIHNSICRQFYPAMIASLSILLLSVLLYGTIFILFPHRLQLILICLLFSCLTFILCFFKTPKLINILLITLLTFNLLSIIPKEWPRGQSEINPPPISPIAFIQKPNIHLFILESYNSLEVRKDFYGYDSKSFRSELDSLQFDIYPNTFSNYGFTLGSVSSIFKMDHHYCKYNMGVADGLMYRKIIGGITESPALEILRQNGYTIDYSQFSSYLFHPADFIQGVSHQTRSQALEIFSGPVKLCKTIFHKDPREFQIVKEISSIPDYLSRRRETIVPVKQAPKPYFYLHYQGASHTSASYYELPDSLQKLPKSEETPLWQLFTKNNYWKSVYSALIKKSDSLLIKELTELRAQDSSAVIILIGDHGAYLNRYCWREPTDDPNKNMRAHNFNPREETRDMLETFVAIHWPSIKPASSFTHVNLFRTVFSILAGNSVLQKRVPDDSFIFERGCDSPICTPILYKVVSDGIPLNNWIKVQ